MSCFPLCHTQKWHNHENNTLNHHAAFLLQLHQPASHVKMYWISQAKRTGTVLSSVLKRDR